MVKGVFFGVPMMAFSNSLYEVEKLISKLRNDFICIFLFLDFRVVQLGMCMVLPKMMLKRWPGNGRKLHLCTCNLMSGFVVIMVSVFVLGWVKIFHGIQMNLTSLVIFNRRKCCILLVH